MKTLKLSNSDYHLLLDDKDYIKILSQSIRFSEGSSIGVTVGRMLLITTVNRMPDGTIISVRRKRKYQSLANFIFNTEDIVYDHIDRNPFNYQKNNLRKATRSQNQCNRLKTGITSQYKGVYWDKNREKWCVRIKFKNKCFFIGRFASETKAALAYNISAKELHKEFAVLNKVSEPKSGE